MINQDAYNNNKHFASMVINFYNITNIAEILSLLRNQVLDLILEFRSSYI